MYFIISHTHLVFRETVIHSQKTVQYCITVSCIESCNFCNFFSEHEKGLHFFKEVWWYTIFSISYVCFVRGETLSFLDEPFVVLFVGQFLLNPSAVWNWLIHLSGLKIYVVYRCVMCHSSYVSYVMFIIEDKAMIKHQTVNMTLFTVCKPILRC